MSWQVTASMTEAANRVSPGSATTFQTDKPAEYAARIPHQWRIQRDHRKNLVVFSYWLDPTAGAYTSAGGTPADHRQRSRQRHD
jgi:hypothetical protein